jgi:hypothetical protein
MHVTDVTTASMIGGSQMVTELKDKILEIASIAKQCPENLQEKCFEVLLNDFLEKQSRLNKGTALSPPGGGSRSGDEDDSKKGVEAQQEDISEKDLHVKAKRFLKSNNLTIDQINQLFYKEGDKVLSLYDDLKTTKASESQVRIALLHALKNGIRSGEFEFNGEEVRSECNIRKCYDPKNFTANLKNNKDLFENFENYRKKSPVIRLSVQGKSALAEIITDLQ